MSSPRSNLTPLEAKLLRALKQAKAHLEYCGYGDRWEREVADAQKLEEKIDAAVAVAERRKAKKP